MGNTVAPRMCRKDAGTAAVATTTRGRRRPAKSFVTVTDEVPAVAPDATPRRSRARVGPGVSWAGGVGADDDDDAGKGKASSDAAAAAVVTVKIVLKRKDAEALVARLNAQSERERKDRMAELKGEFRGAGDCAGAGGASPTPCRDAWKPRLAPIKEN